MLNYNNSMNNQDNNLCYDASEFVLLSDVIPDILLDIRYYSSFNFVGERIDGYELPLAFITKKTAIALKNVSEQIRKQGLRFKIYDAYRPQKAVDHFVRWASDINDIRMKESFYPEVDKKDLFEAGYIAARSAHSRGSTVDLTLFSDQGYDLDMGSPFDYFGGISHPDYQDISEKQHENRMLLRDLMVKNGFIPYEKEWWHFTLADEPFPDTYFDFSISEDLLKIN